MPRRVWATTLLLVAVGYAPIVAQSAAPLSPAGPPPTPAGFDFSPIPASAAGTTFVPPPVLGAPVDATSEPLSRPVAAAPVSSPSLSPPVATAGGSLPPRPKRAATLAPPTAITPVSAAAIEGGVRPTGGPVPASDPLNDLLTERSRYKDHPGRPATPDHSSKFGDRLKDMFGDRGQWFCSDHAFDGFISPVTNPFLFEDPRSLTEARLIYTYQRIPGGQRDFNGGSVSYLGLQGRVAITNRLSFTLNKLGGTWLNPGSGSAVSGGSGFSEIWLGPKYTFIRSDAGTLLAGGLLFQIPIGSRGPFQHTGELSLVPYVSWGQNFLKDMCYQGINTLATAGYSVGTSSARSDYFYLSGHLDVPIRISDTVKLYPLTELNWFLYTGNGTSYPVGIEGRDMINFGGQAKGHGMLSWAIGTRLKMTETAQLGTAFEFPLAGPKDLMQYRFTVDFILRY